jgi:hypothetical protein
MGSELRACEPTVVMQDVRLIFRNFSGKEGMYNREGDRNFGVLIPSQSEADHLEDCGYNIKYLRAREEGDLDQPWLPVAVNFKGRPPTVIQITSRGQTRLSEADVEMLDWVDIKSCDLIVRPYEWKVQGKSGIKAYLQSLYVTIIEDPLALKYAEFDGDEASV